MGPEDTTLLGWVLAIVGVALAIIAYTIYINLRGEKEESDRETTIDSAPVVDDEPRAEEIDQMRDEVEQLSTSQNGGEESDTDDASHVGANERQEKDEIGTELQKSMPIVPEDQELIPVATILREADSGRIVVRINDEDFGSPEAIRESGNWSRMERLSAEFSNWLNKSPGPSGHEPKAKTKQIAKPGKKTVNEGMITQINRILEYKIRNLKSDQQSVRLVEGAAGSLKVLVGVESFPYDEVPYEEIRELIRESVAEWEAKQ